MVNNHIITLIILIGTVSLLTYRSSFLHNRKLFHLSLVQILYLVIIPIIVFLFLYSYTQKLVQMPSSDYSFLSDKILMEAFLTSTFLTYSGIAIHAITKMLAEAGLRQENTPAAEINRFFHLSFSHNLVHSGLVLIPAILALMEINHIPNGSYQSVLSALFKGISLGGIYVIGLYNYTRSNDNYSGRWADFKATFFVVWIVIAVFLWVIFRSDEPLRQYQLMLPILFFFSVIALLNLVLTFRFIRRLLRPSSKTGTETSYPKISE